MSNLSAAISKALSGFKKDKPMKGSDFANQHFYLSKESSYSEERWVGYPPQDILLDLICDDSVEQINIMKSARVGYSKMLLAALAYFQTHKNRNTAIWQATDSDAINFSKTQVSTMLRDVPIVREAFKNSYNRKCAENTNSMKIFDNRTVMHILGARSAKNFRGISIDCAFLDELSSWDANPDGEGSPVLLAKKRTSGSLFPKLVCGSTPKLKESCLINFEYEGSQLKFSFYIPCPYCEKRHPLMWKNMRWEKKQPETVLHYCPQCEKGYTQNQYLDVWHNIRLQNEDGIYYHDGDFYDATDTAIETPRSIGVHLWAAYIPSQTWQTLVQEWLDCYADPATLRTFINTTLGEVDSDGAEGASAIELAARTELESELLHNSVECITMGVDIQGDRMEFEVVGWNDREESWSIDYRIIYGDPLEDDVWNELLEHIVATYEREDGEILPISRCLVDSGNWTTRTYECVHRMGLDYVLASKGRAGNYPVVEHENDRKRRILKSRKKGGHPIMVGVDEAKIIIYKRMKIEKEGAGYMHVPKSRDESWFDQMTVEKLTTRWIKGYPKSEWVKPANARNEALDCRVYAYAGFKMLAGKYRTLVKKSVYQRRVRAR